MTVKKEAIIWKGDLVGYIEEPKRWPVIWRGTWVPADTEATQRFLDALHKGRYLWIEIGSGPAKEIATIEQAPGNEIELRFSVDEQDTIPMRPPDLDDLIK